MGGGAEKARAHFAAVRGAEAGSFFLDDDEAELNALGYRLLQEGRVAEPSAHTATSTHR